MKKNIVSIFLTLFVLTGMVCANTTDSTAEKSSVVEEELSLEEELELIDSDLLVTEEVQDTVVATDTTVAEVSDTVSDTTEVKRGGPSSGATSFTSSSGRNKQGSDSTDVAEEKDSVATETFSLSDIEIDEVGAVDLDKNVKEYRSPRRAMLYSLAVPGWGQAYTKKTWKSALFGALEVGFIVGAIKFKNDAEDKVAAAHALADANFSMAQLGSRYGEMKDKYYQANTESFKAKEEADSIVMQYISNSGSQIYSDYAESMASKEYFYSVDNGVGSNAATLGWTDNATAVGVVYFNADTVNKIDSVEVGSSALQLQYLSMRKKADDYDNYKQTFIVGIFANHVASAIDAFITARRFNRRLLSMKNKTAYRKRIIDNVNIDHDMAFNARTGVVTKVGLKWNF